MNIMNVTNTGKIFKRFMTGASLVSTFYYAGFRLQEGIFPDQTERETRLKYDPLTDELTDRVINILAESDIEHSDKLRFDFLLSRNSLEMERIGYSISNNKLIVLPVHYALKEEKEFTDDLAEKLKANYPRIARLDLSKLREMFVLSPQELRFAVLCEIRKANWDYVIVDSVLITFAGCAAMSIVYFVNRFLRGQTMSTVGQYTLATLISLVLIGIYFYFKDLLYDEYVDYGFRNIRDLDLVEGGMHHTNKQIQLNKLLGVDATGLERRFVKLKDIYEKLKLRDKMEAERKANEPEDDSDEDDDSDDDEEAVVRQKEIGEIKGRLKPDDSGALI